MEELKQFLTNVEVPKTKKKPKTFLGIAKQSHYENVLSNIYAFYFDINEVHGFKDLFINSLIEIIKETEFRDKGILFEGFSDFKCKTEYTTRQGGRIDLLLKNDEQALLIENKVYHHLNNDLNDYWTTIRLSDENKIGIVLSLHHIPIIKHEGFINITHLTLLKRVMDDVGNYLLKADPTYLVFLKDLYQNTINMSTRTMKKTDIEFYKEHRDDIHHVARFLTRFKDHVKKEIEIACDILNEENPYLRLGGKGGSRLRYYTSTTNSDLMFTIGFDNLFRDDRKNIWMVVELKGKLLKNRELLKQIKLTDEEEKIINPNFYSETRMGWAHFSVRRYSLENIDFENLSQFVADKIEEDHLLSIFRKVELFFLEYNFVK